jgi:hypothetical protein
MSKAWNSVIQENRTKILDRWIDRAGELYTGKMAPGGPVAGALKAALGMVLDGLPGSSDLLDEALTRVTRILAVQDFPPSRAIAHFFELNDIVQDLGPTDREQFRDRLEMLVLQAFDSYMMHREKIYQLKVEEGSRRMHMALRRVES